MSQYKEVAFCSLLLLGTMLKWQSLSEKILGTWETDTLQSMDLGSVRIKVEFHRDGSFKYHLYPVDATGKPNAAQGDGFVIKDKYKIDGDMLVFDGKMRGKGETIHVVRIAKDRLTWRTKERTKNQETVFYKK